MSKTFQEASHDYLLARQRMNEKVNMCKDIEVKMTEILHQIQDAYAARGDQAKTVGSLSLSIVAAEGDMPAGTVIKVYVEPESFPDFEEIDESNEEKKNQVAWADKDVFPATFVFEAVQQREAVAYITVGEDNDDATPLKEFTIPIASLFRENVDAWFNLASGEAEPVAKEPEAAVEAPATTSTQSTTETVLGIAPAAAASTEAVATSDAAEVEVPAETLHEAVQTPQTEEPAAEAATEEEAKEEKVTPVEQADKVEEVADEKVEAAEDQNEETKEVVVTESEVAAVVTAVVAEDEMKETIDADAAEVAPVKEAAAPVVEGRVRVQASFELSEIEFLAQQAVALSKAKADMDVEIRLCDQELSSARMRYERLKASQKPTPSGAATANSLLGGLKSKSAFARTPAKPQTLYERTTAALSSTFTPQRRALAWSVTFFVVVSAVFHTNGDDLLI
ncbi:hypothetical protein H310_01986 [Aphanomyces invadans]|uniref:Uncharacterized protein n=1 Tax=Aphanomyces invadans TaxID=157072 RepID=A0A024UNR4_9STRA|nr:hypothetical protein H310_01986 [Aphanomyces invadans]ETW07477.1 hypothetical protein H310_01986 [Aphanomyces invadans]|eukprot:XP_008863570.1 hypothetical protein H310_01986 [Aphanomyces invadans]